MKITVHFEKIVEELMSPSALRLYGKRGWSLEQLAVLRERLAGKQPFKIAQDFKLSRQAINDRMMTIRAFLKVENDFELALLAYERGYVTIEEDQ